MSNSDIRVVPGPANYFSHPGSLERLSDFLTPTSSRERCGSMASALWPAPNLSAGGLPPAGGEKIRFTGHCSERDVAGLVQASGDDRAVVIGVGGGALLDSAKVLARRLGYRWWPSRLSPPPARRGRRCRCGIATPDRP